MANFSKGDATFAKPYFGMIAEKIQAGEQIKMVGGLKKVDKNSKEIKEFIKAVKTGKDAPVLKIIYPDNKWASIFAGKKWSEIDKTPFSGKGGSGAGAEITALTESMQCYVTSIAFNVKKSLITQSDLTKTNLNKASKFVDADRSLDKCLKNGPSDRMDLGVYTAIANQIYSTYKNKLKGNVYFHRGSSFMNGLYSAKSDCHRNDKNSDTPQAPGSFGNDKWNPGDIWATTLSSSSRPLEDFTSDWGTLNAEVARLSGIKGGKTELLAISLKKAINPTITYYRDPQSKPKNPAKYIGYIYGKNGDFFSSQDMYIHSSSGEVQCRTFNGEKSWQGEIKGKLAAGGKIGGGNLDFYAKAYLKEGVFGVSGDEANLFTKANVKNETFLKEFYKLYQDTNKKQISPQKEMTYGEFKSQCLNQPKKFINSKYACCMLANSLIKSSSTQRNKFISSVFRYASSDTDQSSFYIKVH